MCKLVVSAAQGELEGGGGTSGFNVVAGLCSTARSPYSEGKRPQPIMPDPCGVCSKCRKGRPNGCSASFAHRQDGATGTPRVRHKHAHACRTSCFTCASHLYRRTTRMRQEATASLQCYHLSCRLTGHSEVWSKSCRTLRLSADLFPLTNVATLMLSPRSTRTYPPRLQSTRVPVVTLTQYVPDELRQRRQPPPSHLAREERRTQSYAQAAAQRSRAADKGPTTPTAARLSESRMSPLPPSQQRGGSWSEPSAASAAPVEGERPKKRGRPDNKESLKKHAVGTHSILRFVTVTNSSVSCLLQEGRHDDNARGDTEANDAMLSVRSSHAATHTHTLRAQLAQSTLRPHFMSTSTIQPTHPPTHESAH